MQRRLGFHRRQLGAFRDIVVVFRPDVGPGDEVLEAGLATLLLEDTDKTEARPGCGPSFAALARAHASYRVVSFAIGGPIAIDTSMRVRVQRITRVEQVLDALGGTWPTSDYTHSIRVDGLKAHYVTKPTKVRCAFERRTHAPHYEGYVAETACGLLLNVGSDCWDRWIPAIAEVEDVIRDTMKYDADMKTLAELDELARVIPAMDSSIDGLKQAQRALINWVGPVSKRMREASEDPRKRAVRVEERWVETETGRRLLEKFEPLQGWLLWNEPPSMLRLLEHLDKVSCAIEDAREADPLFNDTHSELATKVRELKRELPAIDRWISEASTFFLSDNLHRVLRVTKQEREATVEGDGLIVTDGGRRVRIDARGEVEL